jgi:hypothetical protein
MEYQLRIKISEIENDPTGVILAASSALEYLEGRTEETGEEELVFTTYLGYSYLLTSNYEKGTALIDKLLQDADSASHNFGKISEIKVLLCLRTGHYQEACRSYFRLDSSVSGGKMSAMFERTGLLFQAYLYLLVSLELVSIEVESADVQLKRLKHGMEKLLVSSDAVDVVHYHIVNLIEQIFKNNHRKAREHWRALVVPKKGTGIRYKYFYTLLSILFEQDFHRLAVERHASKYLKKLKLKPFEGELTISLEEVIQYEMLWQMVLSVLGNKRIKLR